MDRVYYLRGREVGKVSKVLIDLYLSSTERLDRGTEVAEENLAGAYW